MFNTIANNLQKAINLAKKTGDRIIIFDSVQSDSPFVVMSLNEYEKIMVGRSEVRGLTEDELLDKINRDIAIWKSEQELEKWDKNLLLDSDETGLSQIKDIIEEKKAEPKKRYSWAIPTERKAAAEEIIEEDRQYLEDVEF